MPMTKSSLEPLDYKDIVLLPKYSAIKSRDNVNLFNKDGIIPIFVSPMLNIAEYPVVIEMGKLGGVGILHRFFEDNLLRYNAVEEIASHSVEYGVAIGLHDWEEELRFVTYSAIKKCHWVTIDCASGYHQNTINAVKSLYDFRKSENLDFKIMVGNVVDSAACMTLCQVGADVIRVNIGTGIQCLTGKSIGISCPPLTAIADCHEIKRMFPNVMLLMDGGIYDPGDGLKALAFGADGLMMGSLFGRAKEAGNNGVIFGMSSFELADRMNKARKSKEGTVTIIPKEEIRPFKEIFDEFTYGLKSGLSYLGCDDINLLHDIDIEYIYTHR